MKNLLHKIGQENKELKIFRPKVRFHLHNSDRSVQISGFSEKNMWELKGFFSSLKNSEFKDNLFILGKEGQIIHSLSLKSLRELSCDIFNI